MESWYKANKAGLYTFFGALCSAVTIKLDGGATFSSLTLEEYFVILTFSLIGGASGKAVHQAVHPSNVQPPPVPPVKGEVVSVGKPLVVSEELSSHIKWSEGFRDKPYYCPSGKLSIGYGHNLEANPVEDAVLDHWRVEGIAETEADDYLKAHVKDVMERVLGRWPWVSDLTPARRDVFFDMAYNMGVVGLSQWVKTLAAAKVGNWVQVALNIRNSKYASQVGRRAKVNIAQIESGQYQPLDERWHTEKPFVAVRSGKTIMVFRIRDGGWFSTEQTDLASAKKYCDDTYQNDGIGAPSKDIDWRKL